MTDSFGDDVEPGEIGKLPAHEAVAEVLYSLTSALLVFLDVAQFVLAQPVSFADDTPFGEKEVDPTDETAPWIAEFGLQHGRRQTMFPDRQATE